METLFNLLYVTISLIIAIGVILIYDARKITKEYFSTSEINRTTKTLKIVGVIISLIGATILVFV